MQKQKVFLLLLVLLVTPTLAAKDKPKKDKGKGPVSIVIQGPASKVKAAIVARLTSQGFGIDSDTEYQLTFSREIDGMKGVFTQMLMGNEYSERPRYVVYFTFAQLGEQTTVVGRQEAAVRMAFGKMNRVSLDQGKNREDMHRLLSELKAKVEIDSDGPSEKSPEP